MWEKRYFSEPANITTIKHFMRHAAKEKIIQAAFLSDMVFFFGKNCIVKKKKKRHCTFSKVIFNGMLSASSFTQQRDVMGHKVNLILSTKANHLKRVVYFELNFKVNRHTEVQFIQ